MRILPGAPMGRSEAGVVFPGTDSMQVRTGSRCGAMRRLGVLEHDTGL